MRANEQVDPAARAWLGAVLGGRYEVRAFLGSGGMGTVFRARDGELDEDVALKILRRDLADVPGIVDRFRREVKLARRVTHRNVARVFDIGEHGGEKFLTMELVEGEALADRLRRAPLRRSDALRISLALAEGLSAAHAAGVVHRDLKPENVLLAAGGRVVITDFGIARARLDQGDPLHTFGSAVGTPAYMAPEQVEPGDEIDARADIYALGAVMFELFTGRRAWPGDAPIAVAAARLLQPPPDPLAVQPDLPVEYAKIIHRCLARKPADRFPSAEAVTIALRVPSPWLVDGEAEAMVHADDPRTAPTVVQLGAPTGVPLTSLGDGVFSAEAAAAPSGPALSPLDGAEVGAVAPSGPALSPSRGSGAAVVAPSGPALSPSRGSGAAVVAPSGPALSPSRGSGAAVVAPSGPALSPRGALHGSESGGVVAPSGPALSPREPAEAPLPSLPRASATLASPAPHGRIAGPPSPRAEIASAPPIAPAPTPPSSGAAQSAPRTVAVLPFRNAGGDDDEYLADGLTDELIDTLSMTPGLRVRSRGVVMMHKGTVADPREVGSKLDVGLVVEGTIRRTPSGVRITARVVSVSDGSQVWAKRFDRRTVDVFEVSDEVARAVAEALTLDDAAPPAREAPTDPIAMDLYLRGRQEYRRYWPEPVRKSAAMFEEALVRAPDNPTILSAYSMACARMWWFGGPEASAAGVKARQAAERALAAAPHLGEPHAALAQVMWNGGDAAGAARALARALARAPAFPEAHALRGRILVEAGRLEAGLKSLQTALSLDPSVPLAVGELARAHAFLGRWEEVPALAERTAATEGPQSIWFMRARFALWRRDRAQAETFLEHMQDGKRVLAVARWLLDQILAPEPPAESVDLSFFVANEEASARRRSFVYQIEAEVRAFHGQSDAALASIERSVTESLFDLAWLDNCPLLTPLRGMARFRASRAIVEDRVREVLGELG